MPDKKPCLTIDMLEYKRIYARVHCPACEGFKDCKGIEVEYIPLKFHYTEPAREADLYCPDFEPKGVTPKCQRT